MLLEYLKRNSNESHRDLNTHRSSSGHNTKSLMRAILLLFFSASSHMQTNQVSQSPKYALFIS